MQKAEICSGNSAIWWAETEMRKEEGLKNMEVNNEKNNGIEDYRCNESGSSLFSLLASKDRDFLLSPTGTEVKISELESKIIGIYFSANWHPPCQKFTEVLAETYEQCKKNNGPGFEVVFVSSDEDLDAFDKYRLSMPWLAIPFSDLDTKRALNRRFDVEGIPCLIILQPNTNKEESTIQDGVELIYRYGIRAYPFTKERLEELVEEEKDKHDNQTLKELLANHERDFLVGHSLPKQVPVTSLMGKTIGLYFSAQWCSPGVKFTPRLISIYQKIKQESTFNGGNDDFEVILVSIDNDETTFNSYFQTMPWLALPFADPTVKDLIKYFDVQGIPSLVILSPDAKTVTKQGRNLVNLYQENAYPFTEARIELLERKMDEEAKNLPKSEYHAKHSHELKLVSRGEGGGPFICCDCDEQGSGWTYLCIDCGYEVHPKCIKAVEHVSVIED